MPDRALSRIASIPVPRDRQDQVLRERIAPLLTVLRGSPSFHAAYFERFNKPDWGVRLSVLGGADWLDGEAYAAIERALAEVSRETTFVPDDAQDKWVGGAPERAHLAAIYDLDTRACLERLEAESRGAVEGNRAQWSLLVVERLLDLFDLDPASRLAFYRRGFDWEIGLGRWDEPVLSTLDRKYDAQASALAAALPLHPDEASSPSWEGRRAP